MRLAFPTKNEVLGLDPHSVLIPLILFNHIIE